MEQNQNPIESAQINSVSKDEFLLIIRYWFLALLVLFISLGFFWFAWSQNNSQVAFVGVLILVAGFGLAIQSGRSQFMKQVASALGYQYSGNVSMETVSGNLFNIGHSQRIFNTIEGVYTSLRLRIYNYRTEIGYGKNRQVFQYTVFEITYPYNLPNFLLTAKESVFAELSSRNPVLPQSTKLKLEGDFNKYFDVSVQQNFEMEAYEILTPDIMDSFIQKSRGLNFELSNHKLYIFQHGLITTKDKMSAMYNTSTIISQMLSSHFKEVSSDVSAMESVIADSKASI